MSDLLSDFFYSLQPSWKGKSATIAGELLPFSVNLHTKLMWLNMTTPDQADKKKATERCQQMAEFDAFLISQAIAQIPESHPEWTYGIPKAKWEKLPPEFREIWPEKLKESLKVMEEVVSNFKEKTANMEDEKGRAR